MSELEEAIRVNHRLRYALELAAKTIDMQKKALFTKEEGDAIVDDIMKGNKGTVNN